MKHKWDTITENINLAFFELKALIKRISPLEMKSRGRRPKHAPEDYLALLVLKEFDNASLRKTEIRLSEFIVGERVDHSVIAYWENKPESSVLIAKIIKIAGTILDKSLKKLFAFVDATKFSSWTVNETEVHICNKIAVGTVYPVGISFQTKTVKDPVSEAVPEGRGKLYADAWYDDNKALRILFKKGYEPIVFPNKNRWKGYWRKKARMLYRKRENRLGYRQRGRGESVFGALTIKYGDRLNARNENVMKTRIASRILAYQLRLILRTIEELILILRHSH